MLLLPVRKLVLSEGILAARGEVANMWSLLPLALVLGLLPAVTPAASAPRPNILVFLVDGERSPI